MFTALNIFNLKIKETDLSKLLSNKSTRKISSSVVKLYYKNISISFKDKIRPIQLVLELLKTF